YDDELAWKIIIDGVGKQGLVEAFYELFNVVENKFSSQTYSLLIEGPPASTERGYIISVCPRIMQFYVTQILLIHHSTRKIYK
ncbi:unnamed protein product, partial [Arabidopsis halleri]